VVLFFIFAGISKAWQGIKEFSIFWRVLRVNRQGAVLKFLSRLAELPPDTVPLVLSQILLPIDEELYIEELVRKYTQVLPTVTPVGIHESPTGKVNTKYYVDILSACCDADTRRKLAQMIALKVAEICRQDQHAFEAIAVSARGNVLLAAEVGDLLDKPIVLIGDLAGVTFPERMQAMPHLPRRYIIVDGLSASGEETLYVANLINGLGGEVRFVFTIIDRCFGAKDRVRNESPFSHPLELFCLAEYDDRRCAQIFNKRKK
jgi:orotate phosphoribosyltransferase